MIFSGAFATKVLLESFFSLTNICFFNLSILLESRLISKSISNQSFVHLADIGGGTGGISIGLAHKMPNLRYNKHTIYFKIFFFLISEI